MNEWPYWYGSFTCIWSSLNGLALASRRFFASPPCGWVWVHMQGDTGTLMQFDKHLRLPCKGTPLKTGHSDFRWRMAPLEHARGILNLGNIIWMWRINVFGFFGGTIADLASLLIKMRKDKMNSSKTRQTQYIPILYIYVCMQTWEHKQPINRYTSTGWG